MHFTIDIVTVRENFMVEFVAFSLLLNGWRERFRNEFVHFSLDVFEDELRNEAFLSYGLQFFIFDLQHALHVDASIFFVV